MKWHLWLFLAVLSLAAGGCLALPAAASPAQPGDIPPQASSSANPTVQATKTPTQTATWVPTPTPTALPPSPTLPPPTETPTPTLTPSPEPTATATWVTVAPRSEVVVPILMYHRIRNEDPDNRYNVVPEVFRSQMQTLADLGYTTLTTAQLAQILLYGGALPPRPIVITFDDGYLDVYETAWPIMQAHGFVGSFYIVSSYVGGTGFANAEQLKEMAAAGWEIGSHSQSHLDLPANHNEVYAQLAGSKTELEKMLGVSIDTVAYPFGQIDAYVVEKTIKYGYLAGVGLGNLNTQSTGSLFYLSRREVRASYTHSDFLALLPWTEPFP